MLKRLSFIKSLLLEGAGSDKGSVAVTDQRTLQQYIDDPDFPFLVSFPRTGSHWLRMLMELYFKRPSLVRLFYYHTQKNYLSLHTHDMDLDIVRKNVIYLYRNPVQTIYSQMNYEKDDLEDEGRVMHWAMLYGRHLCKWLREETFSEKKVFLKYESLEMDLVNEFAKVAAFFSESLDVEKLLVAQSQVSKGELKKKTTHDDQVVNLSAEYSQRRQTFEVKNGDFIKNLIFGEYPDLITFFSDDD